MHPHTNTDIVAPLRPKTQDVITVVRPEALPILDAKAGRALLALLVDTHKRYQTRLARETVAS
ncbi:hypothetical protein [Nocardioides campestrisoli]|uniref:hypothetical protein n=1 Tax=Nocardioides campestrisoli TaxID=2736757 RepID=UPI00163D8BF0|nr:hypothetical protein [Nocardioides campestrisoli]